MPIMATSLPQIRVTEDGEVLATVQQFAGSLDLSHRDVLRVAQENPQGTIVLNAGNGRDRLLILDACSFDAFLHNAGAQLDADTSVVSLCT